MIGDFRQEVREAFLAHRLNRTELVRVAEAGEDAPRVFEECTDPALDLRDPVSPEQVDKAVAWLGLDREFSSLDADKTWTPYERALFRRMSHPDYDPAETALAPDGPGNETFVLTVKACFEDWDRDHDMRLDAAEIDRAMADPSSSPREAAALVVLRSFSEALGSCNPYDGEGVSHEDLGLFAAGGIPGAGSLTARVGRDFEALTERASSLGDPGPLADESMDPLGIRQNRLGSCVLLSTAAGMSESELRDLFEGHPDGSATVKFRDGESEEVYGLTPAERLFHASAEGGAEWPGLLEMAMGQRLARRLRQGEGSARTAADGVPPEEALEALTGRKAARSSLDDLSLNATRDLVRDLCSRPGPRICGSRPTPILTGHQYDVEDLHNGILTSHAYTLLGYDEATDTVTLRNPHHRHPWAMATEGTETGVFPMPLAEFYASFRWVAAPAA